MLASYKAQQASLHDRDGVATEEEIDPVVLDYFVHPTALVDMGAVVGKGSKIWHFSHVMRGSIVGERCNLGQNVVCHADSKLGVNVKVQNNVSIYGGVVCEDDAFLGPSMVFTNISTPRSAVVRKSEYAATIVKRGATIGANATIVCGHTLGEHSFVGAGAVVTKDVKPYAQVVGNPARHVGWRSAHGGKLRLPVKLPEGSPPLDAKCEGTGVVYRLGTDGFVRPVHA
jgi:UDP-2-acetamido-3-amino-2,3-dideoxy-glucuronate N-acetyltransferase